MKLSDGKHFVNSDRWKLATKDRSDEIQNDFDALSWNNSERFSRRDMLMAFLSIDMVRDIHMNKASPFIEAILNKDSLAMTKTKKLGLDWVDPVTKFSGFTTAIVKNLPVSILWQIVWLDELEVFKDHGRWLKFCFLGQEPRIELHQFLRSFFKCERKKSLTVANLLQTVL